MSSVEIGLKFSASSTPLLVIDPLFTKIRVNPADGGISEFCNKSLVVLLYTSIFPEMGYDAGKKGEFDYRIAKNYAEGGELEEDSPMDMGIGGMQEGGMNDKELISSAIDVIQGEIIDTTKQQVILAQFVSQFGQDALKDLIARVESGDIPAAAQEGDGKIEGAGDGMADMVPATMEGDQDVLLSDGEFVVPADVVSGIGNGSSDAGSNKLEDMMDRVRELRTGGTTQPPAIPDEMMLPA